jgi:hypothetical protein
MADPERTFDADVLFGTFRQSRFIEGADPNRVFQSNGPGTGQIQPVGFIQDGVVTSTTFDSTAPDAPTGLTLSSDIVTNSDNTSYVRLLIGLVQPSATDLFGSYVEVTPHNDGLDPPAPVWDRPVMVLIGESQTQSRIENVRGSTTYWARARAADVLGNFSTYTATVSHTTIKDNDAPPVPQGVTVTAGYRGFSAYWAPSTVADILLYEYRHAPDLTGAPDTAQWVYAETQATTIFVGDLPPDQLRWFQVRAVDTSGNVATSDTDPTAVQADQNPEAGWAAALSVTPNLIGSADLAVASVSAALGHIADLNADQITAGTITLTPTTGPLAIRVNTAAGTTVLYISNDGSAKFVDEADPNRYLFIDSGVLKFTEDGGASFSTAMDPDGIYAEAIRLGSLAGGHNLIKNSGFESVSFVAASSTAVFTNTGGTPGWKAANRTTSPDNVTEGNALTVTTTSF